MAASRQENPPGCDAIRVRPAALVSSEVQSQTRGSRTSSDGLLFPSILCCSLEEPGAFPEGPAGGTRTWNLLPGSQPDSRPELLHGAARRSRTFTGSSIRPIPGDHMLVGSPPMIHPVIRSSFSLSGSNPQGSTR